MRLLKNALVLGSFLSLTSREGSDVECCGIVGIGVKEESSVSAQSFLARGIELVKNRGYDSAGVATFFNGDKGVCSHVIKHAYTPIRGCIEQVTQELLQSKHRITAGIGHTRWATCGEKTTRNAHPHSDAAEEIFLVHNGILINHMEIKNNLLKGVEFRSETDTEVIVQLLGKLRREGLSMMEALRTFAQEARVGSQWGIVVVDKKEPNTIYTSTNGSPILVGFAPSEQQFFIASELIVFQEHADCYIETNDNQVFRFNVEEISLLKEKFRKENRIKKLDLNVKVLSSPQPYESFYSYQIREQAIIPFKPQFQRILGLQFGQYLTIIGCGSSYNAAKATEYIFYELDCFKKIQVLKPENYYKNSVVENETVVFISQSGQTKDLLNILQKCRAIKRVSVIGIINVEGSKLSRKVDFSIYMKIGREISVGATKSYFHQILNTLQFAILVAEKKKTADQMLLNSYKEELLEMPNYVKRTIEQCEMACQELANIIYQKESLYLLAHDPCLAIAHEAALKLKELTYIHAEAMGANDMKHGPIALIQSNKPLSTVVILFVMEHHHFDETLNTLDQIHSRNAYIILVTDCISKIQQNSNKLQGNIVKKYHFCINIPSLKYFSFILSVVPMQILAEKIAKIKGIKVDEPRNLAKCVVV